MTLGTRRALFIALQVLVLAAFAFAIEHWWGFERLLAPWQQVPLTLVLLAIVTQAASYGLRALRVYLAEPRVPRGLGGWARCLQLALLNNALNLLLPARTGEASFPLLLQRFFGVPIAEGAGTLLWLRLLDLNVLGVLALFHKDPDTKAILYLGEIGGSEETFVAEYASSTGAKPVAALIVGKTAPAGKKMGHAAALIGSKAEGHAAKQKMLRDAGVFVADNLGEVVAAMHAALARA